MLKNLTICNQESKTFFFYIWFIGNKTLVLLNSFVLTNNIMKDFWNWLEIPFHCHVAFPNMIVGQNSAFSVDVVLPNMIVDQMSTIIDFWSTIMLGCYVAFFIWSWTKSLHSVLTSCCLTWFRTKSLQSGFTSRSIWPWAKSFHSVLPSCCVTWFWTKGATSRFIIWS